MGCRGTPLDYTLRLYIQKLYTATCFITYVPRTLYIAKTCCIAVEVQNQSLASESKRTMFYPIALSTIKQTENIPSTHALRFALRDDR